MTPSQIFKPLAIRLAARGLGGLLFVFAASSLTLSASPQSPSPTAPAVSQQLSAIPLKPGKTLDRALKGGASQSFLIRAKKGQFFHVEAEQLGIDVALTLFGPDGKPIAAMDTLNNAYGPEKLSAIAHQSGDFRLQVTSGDSSAAPGHYKLTLSKPGKPTQQDQVRITAERQIAEATILFAQLSADSQHHALQEFEECAKLWHEIGDAYEEGMALMAAAQVLTSHGQLQPAVADFTAALPLLRASNEPQTLAEALISLGQTEEQLSNHDKSIAAYNEAVALEKTMNDPAAQSAVLNSLAMAYLNAGEKQNSLDCFNQALPLERGAGSRSLEAFSLSGIGKLFDDLGDKQKALDYYNQSLRIRKAIGDQAGEAITLNNIGWVLDRRGQKQDALADYNQALVLERAVGAPTLEGNTLGNIGSVYNVLGDKQKALQFYNQSLQILVQAGDRSGQAATLANLSYLYEDLGETQKALDLDNQALSLAQATNDPDTQAAILSSIGKIYNQLGDYPKALDSLNRALSLEKQFGSGMMEIATLNNLGSLYTHTGDTGKALDDYNEALSLDRQVGDPQMEAALLDNLGQLYGTTGEKQKELESLQQAIVAFARSQDLLGEGAPLSILMNYWADAGQPQTAIFFGKQAVNRIQLVRSHLSGLGQEDQTSFVKSKEAIYRKLATLLIGQGRLYEAEQVLDLLKDQQYFDFIRQDTRGAAVLTAPVPMSAGESDLDKQFQEISDRVTAIGAEWAALQAKPSRTPEEDRHLTDLTAQLNVADQEWSQFLDNLYSSLKITGIAQQSVRTVNEDANAIQKVVRKLDPGTVALYTMLGDDKYRVIVVTPDVTVAREYPITAADLRQKLLEFRQALSNPYSDPLPLARELYTILVGPVAQDLQGAKATTLLWSLDDDLRYIPIAALNDGQHYLVEKYATAEFTPSSLPDMADKPEVKNWLGVGMGVSKAYGNFPALPSVQGELQDVIREAGSQGVVPGEVLLDDTFTEANMKKALGQNPAVVHIASHFYYAPGNETDSFLLLGGADSQGAHLTLAELHDDPSFDFTQTKLLTLSACDTAVGGADGDGREVDGLGNVAHDKGAEAVLASLWDVNDKSTGLLMQQMYRLWTTSPGMSKSEALRRAQVALLRDPKAPYASPYYWAPFVLIGNPR
jgi:CHAT domain-containing protein/Tfp pilus assembly protein PilF